MRDITPCRREGQPPFCADPGKPPVHRIRPPRLLQDLATLRSFGAQGHGVVRPSLSPVDMQARRWLASRMSEAGLEPRIDGLGNVFGRSTRQGPALLAGSHSDTQPTGGWLDGALGVIVALETARALAEHPDTACLALDVVAWVDEESTFLSCMGSRAFCGLVSPQELAQARNKAGQSLGDALGAAGLDGAPAQHEPGRHIGYLEAHIEQGPHLEAAGQRIGVVTAIVGSRNVTVDFAGQQNHAGTTPMPLRRDAGLALMQFGHRLHEVFRAEAGPKTVWTMGRLEVHPGAPSIIPGRAQLHLQFRDPDDARLERLQACAQALADEMDRTGPVGVSMRPASPPIRPAAMDEGLRRHLSAAAEAHAPGAWQAMPSAAVHDAMFLSSVMPAAMMFIPSIHGISHDFAENSSDEDIVLGCQVFADAAARILCAARR
jgi:N-carbamoyl-L-amino-acid hydrolase